jgi:hypothetical protein
MQAPGFRRGLLTVVLSEAISGGNRGAVGIVPRGGEASPFPLREEEPLAVVNCRLSERRGLKSRRAVGNGVADMAGLRGNASISAYAFGWCEERDVGSKVGGTWRSGAHIERMSECEVWHARDRGAREISPFAKLLEEDPGLSERARMGAARMRVACRRGVKKPPAGTSPQWWTPTQCASAEMLRRVGRDTGGRCVL